MKYRSRGDRPKPARLSSGSSYRRVKRRFIPAKRDLGSPPAPSPRRSTKFDKPSETRSFHEKSSVTEHCVSCVSSKGSIVLIRRWGSSSPSASETASKTMSAAPLSPPTSITTRLGPMLTWLITIGGPSAVTNKPEPNQRSPVFGSGSASRKPKCFWNTSIPSADCSPAKGSTSGLNARDCRTIRASTSLIAMPPQPWVLSPAKGPVRPHVPATGSRPADEMG